MPRRPPLVDALRGFGTTVFSEMTSLADRFDAVNLGQGFPDFEGPEAIREVAIEALRAGQNQYVRSPGLPRLVEAIARHQRRFYDLVYDPFDEITVTHGATEGLCAALQALCGPGDEVILFEPFYDSYRADLAMAGATERVVTLEAPGFRLDPEDLARAVGPATRAILLNSPHNPSGAVFDRPTLEAIAEIARRHDLLVLSDEVYEHLVFDGEHVPIATLPGMRERTLTISSGGKSFSFTGWKVGWVCAPPDLTAAVRTAHQFLTFCGNAPFQAAIAAALDQDDDAYRQTLADYRSRRDLLVAGLRDVGFGVEPPAGGYFVLADIRPLGFADDVDFCRMLPERVGVAAIPPTAFYLHPEKGRHLARFAFCKRLSVLEEAVLRLSRLRSTPSTRQADRELKKATPR